MMDSRPLGIVLALAGAVGTAVAALADPLGIGEGEVFGWLQITGVVVGALVTLFGLVMATEVVPLPGRSRRGTAPQSRVITDSPRQQQRPTP